MSHIHSSTCAALSGNGYCIIAADTRQSDGYLINTRSSTKIIQLYVMCFVVINLGRNERCFLLITGFQADGQKLAKVIKFYLSVHSAIVLISRRTITSQMDEIPTFMQLLVFFPLFYIQSDSSPTIPFHCWPVWITMVGFLCVYPLISRSECCLQL